MQQSQIIGISIVSGGCGEKIVDINIEKKRGQNRSQGDVVSQTSKPAALAITSGEGEASISDKLQDHPNYAFIRQKS